MNPARLRCMLLPGWSMDAAGLLPLARELGADARCRDLPGQGERADENMPASLEGLAAALERELCDGTVLIGWSLGALAAMEIAVRGRVRPAALVLITPTPRFVSGPEWPHGIDVALLERYEAAVRSDAGALRDEFDALLLLGDGRRATAARTLRELRRTAPEPRAAALAAGLTILREADLRGPCGSVAAPVLVVAGGRDRVTPPGAARWLAAALPRATYVEFATAGHALPISHTPELCSAIAGFLSHRAEQGRRVSA